MQFGVLQPGIIACIQEVVIILFVFGMKSINVWMFWKVTLLQSLVLLLGIINCIPEEGYDNLQMGSISIPRLS